MKTEIAELEIRRKSLLRELENLNRKIEDAETEVYRHIASEKNFVQRYFKKDMIIISFGRYWWVDQDGDLLGLVEESDIDELKTLEKAGVFKRLSINNIIYPTTVRFRTEDMLNLMAANYCV